ncbi:chromodomain-helicase-DNA-binding protein 1-like isoform X2 [Hippocampus zosterae]|uniref:chromodomain-helicase-DNA-binding protein 1-like isoform X2 n=1 Tax=Hippocampus zosterae TaxID=109293 RepID=UPI00223CC469|nr:chromodomain-helicase-DNA-binding protein 1-like isoform X2 [Hippocampus zosterae]
MKELLLMIKNSVPVKKKTTLTQSDLQRWGLKGIQLRPYQLHGVQWLTQCLKNQQGCILGDEMGLGKTCQTISLLVYMAGALDVKGPFLVLSPLSVMENWRSELERFSPSLTVLCYKGDKDRRIEIQGDTQDFLVLLTTYELCLKDASFLRRFKWKVLVVDEAHRLKNQNSLLRKTLMEFSVGFRVLLTGTPIQNNLQELYSLLSFIQPAIFSEDDADDFAQSYVDVRSRPALAAELQSILEPFFLRRVKSEVAVDLPKKTELVVYHGMSALQKKYYKALLMKDVEAFGSEQNKTRLLNILIQLRKCVDHPYLFDGVEPEPFEMGEHLIEASGKLCLLDSMLTYLQQDGHRVLLFSQMTRMLDILQDYMEYRGFSYERLDGSVRGEERNLAVKNFSSTDIFVFLLSTKAGGVGLNLTAADTVIFMDSDFNPQNDLQAAARCHRIGQHRPVKVVRLLARDTVEEIMYSRAVSKLELTNAVIEEGRFSLLERVQSAAAGLHLGEILKFGVDKLLSSGESSIQHVKVEKILGASRDGCWTDDQDEAGEEPSSLREDHDDDGDLESDRQNHMYCFEGKDYSKDPSSEDRTTFQRLLDEQLAEQQNAGAEGRSLRNKTEVLPAAGLIFPTRKRRPLTQAELEMRRRKRQEAAAKRAKYQAEAKKKQEEHKLAWWASRGYRSRCLKSADSDEDDDEEEDEEEDGGSVSSADSESGAIHYVLGDVTHPHAARGDAIIVHCVDDSGWWGKGGLFTALEVRSDEPRRQYELAGEMNDLDLGSVLFFPIDDKQSRLDGNDHLALVVAQRRDRDNKLSGIFLTALDQGLRKIHAAAKRNKASVHLPRIGHATKGFNWYGTERLIRKHLASRGIPTFIYYHSRKNTADPPATASASSLEAQAHSSTANAQQAGPSSPRTSCELPSFMRGIHVFFYNLTATDRKRLARYLITYDGDEEEVMSDEVTHIVAEVEHEVQSQELRELTRRYHRVVPVRKDWLEACFSQQRLVHSARFTHALTE